MEQEQRVNNLESRLQELSETIGTYDRLRQHDQAEIGKLQEKVTEVTQEKLLLSREMSMPRGEESVTELRDKFLKLKDALKEANMRAENPSKISLNE